MDLKVKNTEEKYLYRYMTGEKLKDFLTHQRLYFHPISNYTNKQEGKSSSAVYSRNGRELFTSAFSSICCAIRYKRVNANPNTWRYPY